MTHPQGWAVSRHQDGAPLAHLWIKSAVGRRVQSLCLDQLASQDGLIQAQTHHARCGACQQSLNDAR